MEKQTEKIKCELARQQDFNLFQTFKIFDEQDSGQIQEQAFLHHLLRVTQKEYNRTINEQVFLIFQRYDYDRDGSLNY